MTKLRWVILAGLGLRAASCDASDPASAATGSSGATAGLAGGESAYAQLIAPMFAARCVECHGERKKKAELALNSFVAAARGSDAGPVWVPGRPAESVLLQRMRRPLDDEERMPPADRPQPAAGEVELLERWIAAGAGESLTVDALQLPAELRRTAGELPARWAAIRVPEAEPAWELDVEQVAGARAPLAARVFELQREFPGALGYESRTSARLHFSAVGLGRGFGDREFAKLAEVAAAIVWLDLSGTAVTDASAPVLARFVNLIQLRASFTEFGDAAMAALAGLAGLEQLTIPGTRVTASSAEVLRKLPALRALRAAGTALEPLAKEAGLPVVGRAPEPPANVDAPIKREGESADKKSAPR